MRRLVLVLLAAAACGGVQVPQHNGYKANAKQPWKKPKVLKLDDKGEAKDDGNLSYPDMRRAKWYAIDTPSYGQLEVKVDITPPGDNVNDDFDLAVEMLDPGSRTLFLADAESQEDAHELTKKHTTVDLAPGRYLVHLYLESRLDTADYALHVAFKPAAAPEQKSDFPAQVPMLPPLPQVALNDEAPSTYKPAVAQKPTPHVRGGNPPPHQPPPPKDPTPPPETLSGRIVGISAVTGGTQIIIGRSTSTKAQPKMHGQLKGIAPFDVSCNDKACVAVVPATVDQVKSAGDSVVLTP